MLWPVRVVRATSIATLRLGKLPLSLRRGQSKGLHQDPYKKAEQKNEALIYDCVRLVADVGEYCATRVGVSASNNSESRQLAHSSFPTPLFLSISNNHVPHRQRHHPRARGPSGGAPPPAPFNAGPVRQSRDRHLKYSHSSATLSIYGTLTLVGNPAGYPFFPKDVPKFVSEVAAIRTDLREYVDPATRADPEKKALFGAAKEVSNLTVHIGVSAFFSLGLFRRRGFRRRIPLKGLQVIWALTKPSRCVD